MPNTNVLMWLTPMCSCGNRLPNTIVLLQHICLTPMCSRGNHLPNTMVLPRDSKIYIFFPFSYFNIQSLTICNAHSLYSAWLTVIVLIHESATWSIKVFIPKFQKKSIHNLQWFFIFYIRHSWVIWPCNWSRKITPSSFLSNWAQLIHPSGFIYTIVSMDHDHGPNLGKTQ